jgi:hypothetical protein
MKQEAGGIFGGGEKGKISVYAGMAATKILLVIFSRIHTKQQEPESLGATIK